MSLTKLVQGSLPPILLAKLTLLMMFLTAFAAAPTPGTRYVPFSTTSLPASSQTAHVTLPTSARPTTAKSTRASRAGFSHQHSPGVQRSPSGFVKMVEGSLLALPLQVIEGGLAGQYSLQVARPSWLVGSK